MKPRIQADIRFREDRSSAVYNELSPTSLRRQRRRSRSPPRRRKTRRTLPLSRILFRQTQHRPPLHRPQPRNLQPLRPQLHQLPLLLKRRRPRLLPLPCNHQVLPQCRRRPLPQHQRNRQQPIRRLRRALLQPPLIPPLKQVRRFHQMRLHKDGLIGVMLGLPCASNWCMKSGIDVLRKIRPRAGVSLPRSFTQ